MIVVESGGTKSTWIFRNSTGERLSIELKGLHPQEITSEKKSDLSKLVTNHRLSGQSVYFYGAGCESEAGKSTIVSLLQSVGLEPKLIESDVVGACIAVLHDNPGVAGILGTGAVAAYYNGNSVERMASGRGFILGDEGSGFDIGKRVTIAYLDGLIDDRNIMDTIASYYGGHDRIVHACSGADSRFLIAGLTQEIGKFKAEKVIQSIIHKAFDDFVNRAILPLPKQKEIGIVGSVGYHFQEELSEVLNDYGMKLKNVVPAAAEEVYNFIEEKI